MYRLSSMSSNFFNPILLYHATFSDLPNELDGHIHNVQPENLYQQLSWLKQNHDFVFVDDFFSGQVKQGSCAVTFDDAYLSVFDEALPVLESLQIPCTIFINSSSFEGRAFWRDQVRYLLNNNLVESFLSRQSLFCESNQITKQNFYGRSKNISVNSKEFVNNLDQFFMAEGFQEGMTNFLIHKKTSLKICPLLMYGNHTRSHYVLSSLESEQQYLEIDKCHHFLRKNLPELSVSKAFSIPFGGEHSITSSAMNNLQTNGYSAALMSRSRLNVSYKMLQNKLHNFPIFERFMPVDDLSLFKKQFLGLKVRGLYNLIKSRS